ncbi:MAG: S-layer homology domain-containing protein, partial [Clostridia bacterium]|nr:S-layer homology domain-containing protein [Clostridia bacterium]
MKKRILSLILALVTAAAVFTAPAAAGDGNSPYRDVKTTRWSFSDIMYVTDHGLMNGVGDGIFSPAGTMTRAMAVTVLWRMQGEPEVKYSSVFSDVKEGKW